MLSEFVKDVIEQKYVLPSVIIGLIITSLGFLVIIFYSLDLNDLVSELAPIFVLLIIVYIITFVFIKAVCYLIIFSLANWKKMSNFKF